MVDLGFELVGEYLPNSLLMTSTKLITLCTCTQQGLSDDCVLSVCLSVDTKISSLSSEGLVEGLVQDRSLRILHNSQTRDPLERLRKAA